MAQSDAVLASVPESSQQSADERSRELSTIGFPYMSLNDGIEMAQAVHQLGGSATYEQIAGHLGSTPTSSSFRTRISTAKVFNLISTGQGTVNLTPLGSRICDTQQEKAARADAFLAVPLYKEVYEKFKGSQLPPATGLENFIGSVGVAQKQRERARQILQKSAQEAGFFPFGKDRLVYPPNIKASAAATPAAIPSEEPKPEKKKSKDDDGDSEELDPFIKGLLKKLPPSGTEWPNEKRAKWLQAAVNIFDLMYTESDDDSRRSITIGFQRDSAK